MSTFSVVILEAERLVSDLLRQIVLSVFPAASCCVSHNHQHARDGVRSGKIDLFVTDVDSREGDVLDLLSQLAWEPWRPRAILVVTSRCESHILATLRTLPISGIFDSSQEGFDELGGALQRVCAGKSYWSKAVADCFARSAPAFDEITRLLTPVERLVFATIGDGTDNGEAARQLGLQKSTISTIRREIHRKLEVRHRGELIRLAVSSGYVCFASGRVMKPGFAQLLAACPGRKTRKTARGE